jgi:hypothetical protein
VKKELMIFLTPFIVNDRAASKRITADELNRTELVDQAFHSIGFRQVSRRSVALSRTESPACAARQAGHGGENVHAEESIHTRSSEALESQVDEVIGQSRAL